FASFPTRRSSDLLRFSVLDTTVLPVPAIVPPVQLNGPDTVRSPAPLRVPPEKSRLLLIVELLAIVSVPAENLMGSELVRLLTASDFVWLWVVEAPATRLMLMTASSPDPGTLPVLRLPG